MRKKGFTLIELLAVLVILVVIALIATPLILNVIDKSKKGAFKDSVYGMINAAEITIASNEIEMPVTFTYPQVEGYPTIEMKGQKPEKGFIEITKEGKINVKISNGTWCASKEETESEVKIVKGSCIVETDSHHFTVDATGEIITSYTGTATDLVIPSKINGRIIKKIGDYVFQSKNLTNVVLPNGLTTIGDYTFRHNQLTNITIPSSVTALGVDTFGSNQLTSVVIPSGVVSIGKFAFSSNQLTRVEISNTVANIGLASFSGNQLTNVVIPSSVTSIEESAFSGNQLTSVKIIGKTVSSQFKTYGTDIWGWKKGYSDTNILWNA